jgi:hypothetical protein
VNEAPLFEQIPPFLHGDESQGFGFGSRNKQTYNQALNWSLSRGVDYVPGIFKMFISLYDACFP